MRSREYFQSLIEQARDLITVVDVRGTILYQSPGINRVLGILPEEVVGRSLYSLVDPEQGERGLALMAAVLSGDDKSTSCSPMSSCPEGMDGISPAS